MSIRKVNFVKGEYYHIYNRGNSKQRIFHDKQDYFHFMDLLFLCNDTENLRVFNLFREDKNFSNHKREVIVSIGSYCLMPNHFHILITEQQEGGISKFMQKLSTAYAMYYNKKYNHTGGLFEGKFKSNHMGNDIQIKYLFSYIHLNPIKLIQKDWKEEGIKDTKNILEFLCKYKWSSYLDYKGVIRKENKILSLDDFPDYFNKTKDFDKEILEWLKYKEE